MKYIILFISLLLIISLSFNIYQYNSKPNIKIIKDTINTETILYDTIPIPKKEYITNTVKDTFFINDTIPIYVDLPITTKEYSNKNDSIEYKLSISGYKPQLDYINIKSYNSTIIETKWLKEPKNRFTHGINLSVGYGLLNRKPDLYIGYGIQISF